MKIKDFIGFNKPITGFLSPDTKVEITVGDYVDRERRRILFKGRLSDLNTTSELHDLEVDLDGASIVADTLEIFCYNSR